MRHRPKHSTEQELPSIMPLVTYLMDDHSAGGTEPQLPAKGGSRAATRAQRATTRRLRVIAANGTAAAPAWSALAWGVGGRPDAICVLAITAVITLGVVILHTATAMYEARQETRRTEIQRRGANTIAAAVSRYIDGTHQPP
jgi:hypothetical protein